jgi:hypothetical protein
MRKQLNLLFVFLLVVISFDFFKAQFLSIYITLYFEFLYIATSIAISMPFIFHKRQGFVLPIQLIFLSMMISIFMANISWGQGILNTILATIPYMLWIFFFFLLKVNFPVKTVEKIILIYGVIFIILYFYQYIHVGTPLFGSQEEFTEERGIARIIFPGGGIFYLSLFMVISKLNMQNERRWLWLLLSILGIVICVMQVTRQSIIAVLFIVIYHLIKNLTIQKKIIIFFFVGLLFFFSNSNSPLIKGIAEQQKNDIQEGKNYIRIVTGTYFLTEFSPNLLSRILGNGVPYALETDYAILLSNLEQQGLYLSDVGIIAMYTMFGILSVFAYILIWYKSFTLSIPKEFYYVKYYLWYLLITSLTSNYVYDMQYLIATVFALYIYQKVLEEEKENKIQNQLFID